MKVTYYANACVLIESSGTSVICDPWLLDGAYYGSWYHYPPLAYGPQHFSHVDYIYLSHIHPDHLDPATLEQMPKTIPILIHDFENKFVFNLIKKLGFKEIIEIAHLEEFRLSQDFSIKILAADNCDPYLCGKYLQCSVPSPYTKTKQIDTLSVFSTHERVLVNTNDCPYTLSKSVCDEIKKIHPTIDFLLVGYRGAGPYPQCFENLSHDEKRQGALAHQSQMLSQGINFINHLQPHFFLPFAGQYVLGGKLSQLNQYLMPQMEELPALFSNFSKIGSLSKLVLLNSGESFNLETTSQSKEFTPPDPMERSQYIESIFKTKKFDYEDDLIDPDFNLFEKLNQALQRMNAHRVHYNFDKTDWNIYLDAKEKGCFLIPFDGSDSVKRVLSDEVQKPYLKISLDLRLLIRILDRKAHWNNAEVGSHLQYFRDPNVFERSIHFLMSFFHC